MKKLNAKYRDRSLFWRSLELPLEIQQSLEKAKAVEFDTTGVGSSTNRVNPLVNIAQNAMLRDYEMRVKESFDQIETVLEEVSLLRRSGDLFTRVREIVKQDLGITFSQDQFDKLADGGFDRDQFYAECVFQQFMLMSQEFFEKDPLSGQDQTKAEQAFKEAGFHAVGLAPCADGRLAHLTSYVLRLPYALVRRKAHAGALFDVSESVRNWVFIEHSRFREGVPNSADEPTRYLKIAVYHFSESDPHHQGCAAHGSDDAKVADAALSKLNDFRQAIENRFGCGSTVQTLLIGMNTDDDSLKIHVPNQSGEVCVDRFIDTNALFHQTNKMTAEQARRTIELAVDQCNTHLRSTKPIESMTKLIAWFIENNFSQIEYVNHYENGCYSDIGHAERFIGIGNGFEEIQLRNLTYYSFLDTVEEGLNDVYVGIKIFTGLNLNHGLPIPIIIRCDYDGRVPGSRDRAQSKAERIEQALHERYKELSASGKLISLCTLRDNTGFKAAERVEGFSRISK